MDQPFTSTFWETDDNHVAVNPQQPEAASGLTEFASKIGLRGCCFFQTSGSEGAPKWVALRKESLLISGAAVNAHFEITAADRWLVALPLHHVGGFAIHARAYLSSSSVVTGQASKWEPRAFARDCERLGITLVSLVPTQVHDLVHERIGCPQALRAAIIGGGGMSQTLADQAAALGWRVFQSYGMTEAASQIATQPYNPFGAVFDITTLEVLPHWQVAVDDHERLLLRGEALARGYVTQLPGGEWAWQEISQEEGLRTRDLVKVWEHGTRRFLKFIGREAGFVKVLGELVHLAPLQAKVEQLAAAAAWAQTPVIAAVPDARRDARLVLVTEPACGGDAAALVAAFNSDADGLSQISEFVGIPTIPRTSLGKVRMQALEEILGVQAL